MVESCTLTPEQNLFLQTLGKVVGFHKLHQVLLGPIVEIIFVYVHT